MNIRIRWNNFIKMKHYNLISFLLEKVYQKYIKKLVNIMDVNIDENIPIDRVMAKPLIGPEPKTNNKSEAIKVVIFASKIVDKTF